MKIKVSKTHSFKTIIEFHTQGKIDLQDFEGKSGEVAVRYNNDTTYIHCGLGEKEDANTVRTVTAKAIQKVIDLKREQVSVLVCSNWQTALEGAILGSYKFEKYKTEKSTKIETLELVGSHVKPAQVREIEDLCNSVFLARDLVNDNAHVVYPESFAKQAAKISKELGVKCTVLNEKEIKALGMGLLTAVGQGAIYPPRLVVMEYTGDTKSKDKTAIIGKGITFDSGGLNLKPSGHIETMRCDMAGAATVLAVIQALAVSKTKTNVIGICALANNAIGSASYIPGDVYTAYNGKTVEIGNTDAEGRLVLADAISYCNHIYKPKRMIDLATLTGGILVALGTDIAGLFCNDKNLAQDLFKSGEAVNERLWELPMYKEYTEAMKSDIADIKNISNKKSWASSITAAAFLQEFVDKTPWAHIDIAGTAFNDYSGNGEIPQYATGFGVRLIMEYLASIK